MNLTQLRSFHAVAEHGGFTAAARGLRISQPAVTAQVKALEAAHQVELFVRGQRRVELTATGKALYSISEQLFGCAARATELLSEAAGQGPGTLRIGADNPYHLMPVLARFHADHPAVVLEVSLGNSREIAEALEAFRIDVGLVSRAPVHPALVATEIARDPIMLVVPAEHRWARRRSIALARLDGEPVLRRERGSLTQERFDRACAAAGVAPVSAIEIGSREALREAIAHGLGVGVISRGELGPDPRLRALAIAGARIELEEHVVCAAARAEARLVRDFVAIARTPPTARPTRRATRSSRPPPR